MSGAPRKCSSSARFSEFSYGPNHPLKVERLQLTMDLIAAMVSCRQRRSPGERRPLRSRISSGSSEE